MCECCGKFPAVGEQSPWFIAEFCEDCNNNRCDAFPLTCWHKESK